MNIKKKNRNVWNKIVDLFQSSRKLVLFYGSREMIEDISLDTYARRCSAPCEGRRSIVRVSNWR